MTVTDRNNVKVSGKGQEALVFAHGYGCDASVWRWVAPSFEPDYRVVVFDHIGFGGSDLAAFDPVRHGSLHGFAEDVLDICRELSLSNAILIGHSVSATIGILAAIKAPRQFASLLLICPSPCFIDDGDYVGGFSRAGIEEMLELLDSNYAGWASAIAPILVGDSGRSSLSAELTELFCRVDPAIGKRVARLTFLSDIRTELPKVRTPSLTLQTSEDAVVPLAVSTYMQRHLPDNHLVLMRATGHCPHLSHPAETIAAIRSFLAGSPN